MLTLKYVYCLLLLLIHLLSLHKLALANNQLSIFEFPDTNMKAASSPVSGKQGIITYLYMKRLVHGKQLDGRREYKYTLDIN